MMIRSEQTLLAHWVRDSEAGAHAWCLEG
jgi:hypothetical protein